MLAAVSSRELTEWQAYERVHGPLGPAYEREMLALLVEGMQRTHHLMGAAHFASEKHPNPVPEPEHVPRPSEWRTAAKGADNTDGG